MNWKHRVHIKQFLTDEEDHKSVQKCMNAIVDTLENDSHFLLFLPTLKKFRTIPEGNDVLGPVDYANKLMEKLYGFCDDNSIWVE